MKRVWSVLLLALAAPVHAECRLCAPGTSAGPAAPTIPLSIEVDAALDLGVAAALSGGNGSISLDALTGARTVTGTLADLGGFSLRGTVRLSGQPFAPVIVTLPSRVALSAPDGSQADVVDIRTDLRPGATLNAEGRLVFGFGGRLMVTGGSAGDFRGRIPVTAEYR